MRIAPSASTVASTPARINSPPTRRADHLDAAIVDARPSAWRASSTAFICAGVAAGLLRQADQHVVGAAELLQRRLAEMQRVELRPHRGRDRPGLCVFASISVPPMKSMP